MKLLEIPPKLLLIQFLDDYANYQKIDKAKASVLINETIKYYKSGSDGRDQLVHLQYMENKWYDALNKDTIDYSVYDDDYYFTDLWSCWIIYSRDYLRNIIKINSLNEKTSILALLSGINSVIDLGCGISYTTATLKQIFSRAKVFGTNIVDTKQYAFCKFMSKKYDFNVIPDISYCSNTNIDLVFASEYFEHIERPLEHLQDVINKLHPKYFLIANAFNTRSIGHFYNYKHYGGIIRQENISKLFNKLLVRNKYRKIKTKLWNNKPNLWQKT